MKNFNFQNNQFAENVLTSIFNNNPSETAAKEMLDKFGLNWKVQKENLILQDGTITDFFGVVRQDNNTVFSTCKQGYTPYQNEALAEMLIRISEKTGFSIHNGGSFKGGAKVFLQLKSPNDLKGIGENNDLVKGYLTGINSHDGSTALKWGETNLTISCSNTFNYVNRRLQNSIKHTTSIHSQVEQSIRSIEKVIEEEKSLFETFMKLSNVELTQEIANKTVQNITGVDINLSRKELEEKNSSRAINKTELLLKSINQEVEQKGESLWGLFSGITHYTTHEMSAPKRENGKLENSLIGSGAKINNEALNLLKLEIA